jgi:DNA topoisomerase VI subunit A
MNIYAAGKATCEGVVQKYLIDYTNRDRMAQNCSFILVCEKATVSAELLRNLQSLGYKVNLVSTGGVSPNDAKESIIQAIEDLEEENFFVLVLHDYDLAGVNIFSDLHRYQDRLIDVGVNELFIKSLETLPNFDMRFIEEKVLNKKNMEKVKRFIENNDLTSNYDYEYLHGTQISAKRWEGHRVEIDAIHVRYGIQPFIDYIVSRLQDITCWDLTRIGIEEQSLEEGDNLYEKKIEDLEHKVGKAYAEKKYEISLNFNHIKKIVDNTLPMPEEMTTLENSYLGEKLGNMWDNEHSHSYDRRKINRVIKLENEYQKQISKNWTDDFSQDLDDFNERLTCWPDDVTTAEEDVADKRQDIQNELDSAQENDEDLVEFDKKLNNINWGEKELENIKAPDKAGEVRKVIAALEKYIEELSLSK